MSSRPSNAERDSTANQVRIVDTTQARLDAYYRANPSAKPPNAEQQAKETNQQIFGTQTAAELQAGQAGVRARAAAEDQRSLAEFTATRSPTASPNAERNNGPITPASTTNAPTNPTKSGAATPSNEEPELVVTARGRSFNINSFRAEINTNDILPTHSYLVKFSPFRLGSEANVPLTKFVINNADKLILRCESAMLPTVQVLEEENIARFGYGPVEKVPYGMQFNDLSLIWLVDKRSELINFFYQWMNTITSYETNGTSSIDNKSERPGLNMYSGYEVGYKDEYACPELSIRVYDRLLNTVTEYILYDVFPINIQSQNLGWNQENEAQKLNVTFAFTNMRTITPLNGKSGTVLEAQSAADEQASASEKNKNRKNDFSRPAGANPQNSVNASSPDATNNKLPKDTTGSTAVPGNTIRNLDGTISI